MTCHQGENQAPPHQESSSDVDEYRQPFEPSSSLNSHVLSMWQSPTLERAPNPGLHDGYHLLKRLGVDDVVDVAPMAEALDEARLS